MTFFFCLFIEVKLLNCHELIRESISLALWSNVSVFSIAIVGSLTKGTFKAFKLTNLPVTDTDLDLSRGDKLEGALTLYWVNCIWKWNASRGCDVLPNTW